jgi:pyruvate kinase
MAEALGRLEEIIEVSDGIMVARGDLGVETPFEELPHWQKKMIALGRLRGKPVITATQMLDSMIRNPRPTRAEVADVANAIIDGTDAVMLSGESASGAYPVEAVRAMAKIAMAAEQDLPYGAITKAEVSGPGVLDSISLSACEMAEELDAAAIIVATSSGRSARATALYRPQAPIIALTESEEAARRLNLTWGVFPLVMAGGTDTDTFIGQAKTTLLKSGLVREGDLVILSASYPAGMRGSTNTLQIQVLGRTFLRGRGAGTPGEVEGMLVYADAPVEGKCREMGCILALGRLEALDASMLEGVAGVVVEDENITTKDDALLKRMGIPALVGVAGLSGAGRVGERVKLDTCRGIYVQCPDG